MQIKSCWIFTQTKIFIPMLNQLYWSKSQTILLDSDSQLKSKIPAELAARLRHKFTTQAIDHLSVWRNLIWKMIAFSWHADQNVSQKFSMTSQSSHVLHSSNTKHYLYEWNSKFYFLVVIFNPYLNHTFQVLYFIHNSLFWRLWNFLNFTPHYH